MQSQPFSDIADACLDQMRDGASIDDCVAPYPDHADELRAQLQTAQSILASRPQIQPEPSAQAQGRARLLSTLAQMREEPEPTLGLVGPIRALFFGIGSRLPQALPAVLAMLVLGGAAWGVSAAAGNPNPGDWFVGSSSQEPRVELSGTITAIAPPVLTVSTDTGEVSVQIDSGTEFEDDNETSLALADFSVGDFVKISAFRDEAGALIAREVELEEEDDEATDENEDGDGDGDGEGDDDADHSGPGSPNSGPGNAEDDDEHDDGDNSGPGNSDDPHEDEADDDDDDRSGPSDNSGPGNSNDAEDEKPDDETDNSGPGSIDDDEHDDEHGEEDDEDPDDD